MPNHNEPPASSLRPYLWGIRVLALAAAALAGYLASQSSGAAVAGCEALGDFDCSEALASRWSRWLGLPVAVVGCICYALVAIASWLIGRRSGSLDAAGWRLLELMTPLVVGAAVWFVGLQVTGSAPACVYCLAVHLCGVLIAGLAILERRSATRRAGPTAAAPLAPVSLAPNPALRSAEASPLPPPALGAATLGGVLMVFSLVLVQVLDEPKMEEVDLAGIDGDLTLALDKSAELPPEVEVDEEPSDGREGSKQSTAPKRSDPKYRRRSNGSRIVKLLGGRLPLDTYEAPILGSPEADHVVVEFMDYACPHCREFRAMLDEARERYGEKLAIVVLPIPGEFLCNRYLDAARPKSRGACKLARFAVAVANVAPAEFERVHAYLLKGDEMPSITEALIYARETVDADDLSYALKNKETAQRLNSFIELYGKLSQANGKGLALPSQILGKTLLQGQPATVDELCEAWEEHLGIEPTATAARP